MRRRGDGAVVYRAQAVAPWLWWPAWGVLGTACVLSSLLLPIGEGLTGFLLGLPIYAITWWIWMLVVIITLWSVDFYGAITLTRSVLRVGRDRLPVTDLDPEGVRRAHLAGAFVGRRRKLTPSEESAAARTAAAGAAPDVTGAAAEPPRFSSVRHLGGAWATPVGLDSVVLPLRDGTGVRVDVRDRAAFLTALSSVVPDR